MKSVFLDTSGLIALTDSDDYWHSHAVAVWRDLLRRNQPLITTSLILIVDVLQVDHRLEEAGWSLFTQRSDSSIY